MGVIAVGLADAALLAQRLEHLERLGIVESAPKRGGHGHRYRLTSSGHDLFKVCGILGEWGARWLEIAQGTPLAIETRARRLVVRATGWKASREGGHMEPDAGGDMTLYDLRVTVDSIEGRSVCGMQVGDYFELVNSSHLRIPKGRHFCVYALQAVLPLLPAKQRELAPEDWMAKDALVCCPDPEERVVMRVERTRRRRLSSADLT